MQGRAPHARSGQLQPTEMVRPQRRGLQQRAAWWPGDELPGLETCKRRAGELFLMHYQCNSRRRGRELRTDLLHDVRAPAGFLLAMSIPFTAPPAPLPPPEGGH